MRIEKPGIYKDMSSADYFADPCPVPSLTQSIAKILLDQSPLHGWYAHSRLNPDFQRDDPTKFDVGNVAHKLMIGRGKEICICDFDDWRTKASQEARKAALANGELAVLGRHYARAERMVKAAREQLALHVARTGPLFEEAHGSGEACLAWEENGIWFRQLLDWLNHNRTTYVDYKTTDMNAAPHCLGRMMVNAGWPIQAAMAERGLDVLYGHKRRRFFFVVQEASEPPYALNVVEMSEAALTMGRKQLSIAAGIWADCITSDIWPSYPREIIVPEYPGYAEASWLDREQTEFSDRKPILTDLSGG